MKKGLYIHIPFCVRKCGYCDFISYVPKKNEIDLYLEGLLKEFKLYDEVHSLRKQDINTIFIGGGTPSILNRDQLEKLFNIINKYINVSGVDEYTIECNPGTLSIEKLEIMKKNNVNRLSIGLQATQENHLKFMERIHTLEEFDESMDNAKKVGFKNINIDLIYAFYGQTIEDWKETLDYVLEKNPSHLSCYSLIIEEGTKFYDKYSNGEIKDFNEKYFLEMYRYTVEKLGKYRYNQYEISNYAKEGFECRHNINYWECGSYYGLGVGASGYISGIRYTNEKNIEKYLNCLNNNVFPKIFEEKLTEIEEYNEKIMLGLRMNAGINYSIIENIYDKKMKKNIEKSIEKYLKKGYISLCKEVESPKLRLTQIGREISNTIIVELMI